jgi:hypothetical protein
MTGNSPIELGVQVHPEVSEGMMTIFWKDLIQAINGDERVRNIFVRTVVDENSFGVVEVPTASARELTDPLMEAIDTLFRIREDGGVVRVSQ